MMKWKRIKCFLTGGHHLYDKNLQVIHDSQGCHFVNYCVKCGKDCAISDDCDRMEDKHG